MSTGEVWQPVVVVYGRETELAALADSESPVYVVAGDVGIGKSKVIDSCRSGSDGISSNRVTIRFVPGALQAALLEALASVLAEVAAEQADVARAGGMLVEAATRLAQTRANDMLKAVGQGVLGYLRNKVGDEAIDLVIGFGRELRGVAEDELALRIQRASDPDVIEAVVELAGEVSTLAGQREMLLRLDNGERLDQADLGRLADICTRLPTGLRICLGFQVSTVDAQRNLDLLRSAGAQVQLLAPLPLAAVERWVVEAGLPQGIAPGVLRMTSGYPLAISDAVVLLHSGASLTALQAMTPRDAMLSATRESRSGLSSQASVAALKLAPYIYPMQASRVTEILGLTREAWAVLRTELVTHRIFLGGDTPWFHETRRRIILEEMYTPAERLDAQRDALIQVARQIDSSDASSGLLAEYALMARQLSALQSDSDLAAVGEFNRDELAIIGALIELTDKDNDVVATDAVLGYAESRFAGTRGMLDALTRLAERGRVVTVTKDSASVTGLVIQSAEVFRYLAGLVSLDLGILPMPRIASIVFDLTVRPLIGDFKIALYGVGEADLGELVKNLQRIDRENQRLADGVVNISDARGLVAQFSWGAISFYLAAFGPGDGTFSDVVVETMRGISQELLGEALRADFALAFPEYKVPARLIPQAFERALGDTFPPGRSPRELDPAPPTADEVEDNLRTQATVRAAAFDLSLPRERLALGLHARSYGYAYSLDPDGRSLTTVRLRDAEGVYAIEPDSARMDEPLFAYRLKVRLGLDAKVNVERINQRFSVAAVKLLEPVGSVLEEVEQVVKRFNQFQTNPVVLLEQVSLQEAFQDHIDTIERNAADIAVRLGLDLPAANDLVFVIDPVAQQDHFVVGAFDRCQVFYIPTDAHPRARVLILDEPMPAFASSWDDHNAELAVYLSGLFGEEFEDVPRCTATSTRAAVSRALGYADGDVRLVLKESDLPYGSRADGGRSSTGLADLDC